VNLRRCPCGRCTGENKDGDAKRCSYAHSAAIVPAAGACPDGYRAVVPPTGMTVCWVMRVPLGSTLNVPKYCPRTVRKSTCTLVPPDAARDELTDVMRMLGSRNCTSSSEPDVLPSVEYAVASSPCATASRNRRTSDSAYALCRSTAAGVTACATVGTGVGARVTIAAGARVGVTVTRGVGDGDGDGDGAAEGVGDAVAGRAVIARLVAAATGVGLTVGAVVTCATDATGVGVCTTTIGVFRVAGAGARRAAKAESNAPIPRPAMMTPANSGTIGKPPRSSSSVLERRRRGEPGPELMFTRITR